MLSLRRVSFVLAGLGGVGVFGFFSYLVHKDLFTALDFDTTVKFQDRIPRSVDGIFSFLSDIGSFEPVLVFLLTLLVAQKKLRGFIALFFFGLFHFIEIFGKTFVSHLPPPEFMLRTERVMNFPQYHVRLENSYPSGHAGRNAFLTVLLVFFIWRSKKLSMPVKVVLLAILAVFDIAMLISRPYLGEHWTTDVVGGVILGSALGLLALVAY